MKYIWEIPGNSLLKYGIVCQQAGGWGMSAGQPYCREALVEHVGGSRMEGKRHIHLLTKTILLVLFCRSVVPAAADITYWNPRPYNVTCIFELEPDPNKIDRAKDLKLWLPLPREWDSQKSVQILSIDPPPDGTYEEPEFGNRMAFWDFGKGPEKTVYTASIKFRLEAYDILEAYDMIRVDVDPAKVGTYDKSSPEYKLYTRNEHTIRLTPKIYELAKEAVGDEKNPYLQARRIAQYVYKKVHYNILDYERGRGIQCLLDYPVKNANTGEEYYEGCCNQISAMVVALCRAVGIPARCVGGYCGWPPENELKPLYPFETKFNPQGLAGAQNFGQLRWHMWTEFYIPNYGWIPDDFLLVPFNCRMVWAKGRDIKIGPQCPEGGNDGYGSQWVSLNDGRADHFFYGVWNIAKIRTARSKSLVQPDPFPVDALLEYRPRLNSESRTKGSLKNWRWSVLGELDYKTRGVTNPAAALAAVFKESYLSQLSNLSDQRNAFVCHMLRNIVGEGKFSQIVDQYERMRVSSGKAIPVAQFQPLAEAVYGQSLRWFFEPWTNETQLPQFKLDHVSLARDGEGWCLSGHLLQTSKLFYRLPVELALRTEQGMERRTLWQEKPDSEFQLHTSHKPLKLLVDPNQEILKLQRIAPCLHWYCWTQKAVVLYGTGAETEANKAAAEDLSQSYFRVTGQSVKADTEATAEDLNAECLILLGRPAVNKVTERLQDRFPIKFSGAELISQGKVYDRASQGVIAVVDAGRSSKQLTILCAGLSAEATKNIGRIKDLYLSLLLPSWIGRYDGTASYLIFDGNERMVFGEWEAADADLVREF